MKSAGKRVTSLLLVFIIVLGVFYSYPINVSAASFTPRLSAPDFNSYESGNPFVATYYETTYDGSVIYHNGNCTWYAWGRAREILGYAPPTSHGNAGLWYGYTSDGLARGSTPKVGAIICWTGHVAVVEKIENGQVTISEGNYSCTYFHTRSLSVGNYGSGFQGFIYLGDFSATPKPTTASIAISKSIVGVGQNVTFSFSANNSPSFTIGIDKDSTRMDTTSCGTNTTYTRSFSEPGNYSAYVTAWNSAGSIDSSRINFTVAKLPGAPTLSVASINNSTGKVNFSWAKTSDTTCYDLRILQNGSVIKTIYSITATTYSYQLPAGNYTAYLCSVNTSYTDWWTKGNDVSFSVVAPPGIPSNLSAVSAGFDRAKLTWTAVSGATGYEIYRSTTATGSYSKIAYVTTATYTNTGLTTNKTYYYKIRAYRSAGSTNIYGGYTSIVSSKPAPSVPTGLKAVSAGYSSIKLTWTAISGATGYEIYRSNTATGSYSKIAYLPTATYTDTGLTTNTTYYYKIRAYRSAGSTNTYGGYTAIVSSKPIPSVPTSLKAESVGYSSIKLTWVAVSGATGFEIYRSNTATGSYSKIAYVTTATYTNTGLTTNTTYYYKIRAYRSAGSTNIYGGYTSYVSSKPVPSIPTGLKAVSAEYSSVKLTWTSVSGASGYEIYRSSTLAGTYSLIANSTTTTPSYSNTGLTASTTYYYKIRAYRMAGTTNVYSGYSAATAGTTSSLSISNGNYHVVSMVSTNQCLNGYSEASTAFPWQVTTAPPDGSTEQIFVLSKQTDGSYILTIQRYNKALTVSGSISAGSRFISSDISSSTSQRFVLTRQSGDYFTVSPYGYPNLVLSKSSTKTYSNTEHYFIQLEEYTGSSNQYWQFSAIT